MIQALLFDKKIYNTSMANRWMKKHGYKPIKGVHRTDRYLRYRIREPEKNKSHRTISFGKGIKAVISY